MSAFQKLMDFRADLERRAGVLRGREGVLTIELSGLEADYPEATIRGEGQAVQGKIDKLTGELQAIRRELAVLEAPPPGGIMADLVKPVLSELRDDLAVKRHFWQDDLRKRLAVKKAEFLELVKEAGELNRAGQSLVGKFVNVQHGVPGPKQGAPEFMTDIIARPDRHEGPIFISIQESEKIFKKGA